MTIDRSIHAEYFTIDHFGDTCVCEHGYSIFNNVGRVFRQIKNPHIVSAQSSLRNFRTNFGYNWSGSVRGEHILKSERNNIKNSEKTSKRAITPTWLNRFKRKFATDTCWSHHAKHFLIRQQFAKPNHFLLICKNPYHNVFHPYCQFLVTACGHFF